MSGNPPTETKVKAAAGGAVLGVAIAEAANWALDTYVHTPQVAGDLPVPVQGLVLAVVTAAVTWAAGWLAKHSPRDA